MEGGGRGFPGRARERKRKGRKVSLLFFYDDIGLHIKHILLYTCMYQYQLLCTACIMNIMHLHSDYYS